MTTGDGVPEVDVEEAKRRFDAGAVLLDVRTEDEWDAGRAAGAVWIPMGEIQARQDEIPTDQPIVVICRSGARSGRVHGRADRRRVRRRQRRRRHAGMGGGRSRRGRRR